MKKLKPKAILKQYMTEALAGAAGRAPSCPHFNECGGCEYQDYAYAAQTAAKLAVWTRLAAEVGLELPAAEITVSPREFGYRQRMDYVFAFAAAGLRQRRSFRRVVALQQCPLLGDAGFAAFRRARELAEENGLSSHDFIKHNGFLRYFVVRRTRPGGVMLSLVTYTREHAEAVEKIARALLAEKLATSVYWLHNPGLADMSFGEPVQFWGEEYLTETYAGKRFFIGPNTFAQANPDVAELAYQRIVRHNAGEKHVCDAYSGTGAIGELLAPHCEKITAVENVPANVELARLHAQANGAANIENVLDDAQNFLTATARAVTETGETPYSAIVVNPPRSGIGEKAAQALVTIGAPKLTYMSCNPQTLITDLKTLLPVYRAESVTLFDMFPQTHHWETLVLLDKRQPAN